jgi:hypothetical protein
MLALVLLVMLAGSGLAFHALAHSDSPRARRFGPWLAAAVFTVASVALLAPFYRHDSSRIISSYVVPQALFSGLIFVEAVLLSRWVFSKWPSRWRFLSAYALLLVLVGGFTTLIFVSAYPGS